MRIALISIALSVTACNSSSAAPTVAHKADSKGPLHGHVTIGGAAATAASQAEVLEVRDGKVIAAVPAVPDYTLPAISAADCKGTTLVARFTDPVGVVTATPPAGCQGELAIDVPAKRIVELTGTIKPIAGTTFDWLDVKLTPQLKDVPPTIILADGTTANLHEALASRHLTAPTFTIHVITGTLLLMADRSQDGPLTPGTANARLDTMTSSGTPAPVAKFGGFELDINAATRVELSLRR